MTEHFLKDSVGVDSILMRHLRSEFDFGVAMAADPQNAGRRVLERRITTVYSPWYMRTCKVCRHKFREGDMVRLCPQCGEPYHDDGQYELHCWQQHFADGHVCAEGGRDRFSDIAIPRCGYTWDGQLPDDPIDLDKPEQDMGAHPEPGERLVTQFVVGLENVWRPYGEQKSFKVPPGSPLVGRKCPWCRLDIRAGDWVVACPCGSNCGTYFHQDIFRHLTCWNEWNGVEGNDYCPTTGAPYTKPDEDAPEE